MVAEAGHAVESTGFDVSNMKVEAPLIALPSEKTHSFRVNAEAKWDLNQIQMSLGSVNETGMVVRRHATFVVLLTPAQTWAQEWKRLTHLVQGRVESLATGVASGSCHHIKRGMTYKLFSALVDYSKEYQGMKDVIIDSDQLEAVSTVEFQVGPEGFHLNPRWIDSLGHIAGFIMNANDSLANKSTVFVNHGWDHLRIAEPMEAGKKYRVYNRMQLVEKSLYAGDTYIFDRGQIIAVFEGVKVRPVFKLQSPPPQKKSIKVDPYANFSSKASHAKRWVTFYRVRSQAGRRPSRSTRRLPTSQLRERTRRRGTQNHA